MKIRVIKVTPIIDKSVRLLCMRPYHNHKKGCPNFNNRKTCPPTVPLWDEVCNIRLATFIYVTRFNLEEHVEKMRVKHPNWSEYQLACCLYWQSKARKPLQKYIKDHTLPGMFMTICPEALGINVTETLKHVGITLEWPPKHYAYQVAMSGWKL